MLVLSRHPKETINLHVGDETIQVDVVRLDGRKVVIGITASQNVRIMRDEIDPDSPKSSFSPEK